MAGGDPCAVCGSPVPGGDPRRVTCGHARCRRERERQRHQRRRAVRPVTRGMVDGRDGPDTEGRARIARLMMGATNGGIPSSAAIETVARLTGERPAVVASVWASMNEAR